MLGRTPLVTIKMQPVPTPRAKPCAEEQTDGDHIPKK